MPKFHFASKKGGATPVLDQYAVDWTRMAANAEIDPVIGRQEEIDRVTQILTRRTKNNVILVGPPGVGKTAIVEGLALKIATHDVPAILTQKRVLSLRVTELLAGTKYRGEFEERVQHIVEDIERAARNIILFVDEVHTVSQAKGAEGAVNLSDILKPALARGDLQLIGATTIEEYKQFVAPDAAWARRFQLVEVDEPSEKETVTILKGIRPKYEEYHDVHITDQAITAAVAYSEKYIAGRQLPDKAIDVIDEAAAMVKVKEGAHPDHAAGLIHGAAHEIAKKSDAALGQNIKQLKKEVADLRKKEQRLRDKKKKAAIAKQIVKKVRAIQEEEEGLLKKKGAPVVDAQHVKQVVAEWSGKSLRSIR